MFTSPEILELCCRERCDWVWQVDGQTLVKYWEKPENWDGDTESRHRQHMRKNMSGRQDYGFLFRPECWALSAWGKKNKTEKNQKPMINLGIPQEMRLFDRDILICSELANKPISAATHSGLMENWKTIQETIATPATGVWSPLKERNHCSVRSNFSLLDTPSVSASLSSQFPSPCLSVWL